MTLRIPAKVLLHVWSYDFYAVVSTCNILAEYVVAGYGLISLPSTVKAILS